MSEALARFQTNEGKTYQIYPEIVNEKVYFTNLLALPLWEISFIRRLFPLIKSIRPL